MKLQEQIHIRASVDEVWSRLIDPATWPDWNLKVLKVSRKSNGPLQVGEQFDATMQLKGRQLPCQVEVRSCSGPRRLDLRQHFEHNRRLRYVDLVYQVKEQPDGVRLVQTTDLAATGIPWLLRALIYWVHRSGRPVGVSALERLRDQLESRSSAPDVLLESNR